MEQPNPTAAIVEAKVMSRLMGNPPYLVLAIQMTIESQSGLAIQPWLAMESAMARRLIELLQTTLGDSTPIEQGTPRH